MTVAFQPAQQESTRRDVINSLLRGLQILELLATAPEGLLAKTISARTGLNLSTCYHLLNTLLDGGYILKHTSTQRYALSGKVTYPSFTTLEGAPLVGYLLPHLQALRDTTGEAAYLSLRAGPDIVLSAIVDSPQLSTVASLYVGFDRANHATALGKAILAYLDDYDVTAYLARCGMPALTARTHTTPAALKRDLAHVRERGFSQDIEEFAVGVCCVGAPIFNATGQVVAALGIPLPAAWSRRTANALTEEVRAAAAAASRALTLCGYAGPR